MPTYSPIVFFAYNRPWHTRTALESLSNNPEAKTSELYIFCDAPPEGAPSALSDGVEQTRSVVRERQWCGHVEVREANEHLGCDESMLSGIGEVIAALGRIVVLEDDLVLSSHFLSYINQALTLYEDDERVGAVSGYMYPITHTELPHTFFHCLLNFWGWGTWRRAWSMYQPDAAISLAALERKHLVDRFMLGRPEYLHYLVNLQGRKDSYDILWYASLLVRKMLVLYPGRSLVGNRGFDLSGTHLAILDEPNLAFQHQPVANQRVELQRQPVVENDFVTEAIVQANAYIWRRNVDESLCPDAPQSP